MHNQIYQIKIRAGVAGAGFRGQFLARFGFLNSLAGIIFYFGILIWFDN
jgi:hypothetical protein